MTREQGAARLARVMREVFDQDDLEYDGILRPGDIEAWDSVRNMQFLRAVEQEFGFRFTSEDLDALDNAGDVLDAVFRRTPE